MNMDLLQPKTLFFYNELLFKEYAISNSDVIINPVSDFFLESKIEFEQSGFKIEHSARIFRGGISREMLQKLEEKRNDIWTYRLSSYSSQFLFTTRTNGTEIKIKETELFPFIFIHPGLPIIFKPDSGTEITTQPQTAGSVCAMDIQSVLKQMPSESKRIDVCPNGKYAFHFYIQPEKLSEEKYLLKFKNSLGVFEILEVTGRAMHNPEFSEESLYETLSKFDFYEEHRARVNRKGVIEVETGYRERREFPFIMDMIQSDEIYFIYPDENSFRCHVKAEKAQYRHLITEPTSIKLKIREVTEEEFSLPKIEFKEVEVNLDVTPQEIMFEESGGTETIHVTGIENESFELSGLPSWLHVENKTANSFVLKADIADTENPRSAVISVKLTNYPDKQATVSVTQDGTWLSEFIFDIETTSANENVLRLINLGSVESGEARFDYGDGSPVENKTVPKSTVYSTVDSDGNPVTVLVGTDFGHVFPSFGTHTVTIKVRQGVDSVRFSTLPAGSTPLDWGAEFVSNEYIRTIRKIKSETLTSIYKTFAGCTWASFASDFPGLETPFVTDVSFAFENFGNKGTFTVNDRMRFPENMYRYFTMKNQITSCNRIYFKSGFEKIEKSMLSFSAKDTLTSVFEAFRQMRNVGANWCAKYGSGNGVHNIDYGDAANNYNLELEEFVETDLFWNQTNISDFTGCFNAINDFYGNYDSSYSYKWLIKKDLFKGNKAPYLLLDAMFNKCTRSIFETGFFADIAQKVHSMYLCFHGFNDGSPRVAYDMSFPNFNGADLNLMFPESTYPNMGKPVNVSDTAKHHMAGAFDFYPSDMSVVTSGFQCLPFGGNSPHISDQLYGTDYVYWRYDTENLRKEPLNISAFLAKFPNVTPTSGIDPRDGITVIDGAAYNFGNYTQKDSNNAPKSDAADYSARPQVVQVLNLN